MPYNFLYCFPEGRWGINLLFISVKVLTFGDDPVLGARLSLTFTKSHSLTGSIIPILLPSLSVICLLVLLITNTKNLPYFVVLTMELTASSPGS